MNKKILFLGLFVALAFHGKANGMEAPFPLVNTKQICYANAVLQSLFQNNKVCSSIVDFREMSDLWASLHGLKVKKQPASAQRSLACAIEIVKIIRQRGYQGSDPSCFAYELANNLLHDLTGNGTSDYYYYEQHPKHAVGNRKCYTVRSQENGQISLIDNLDKEAFKCDSEGLGSPVKLFVAPELNLVIVRLDGDKSKQTFDLIEQRKDRFMQRLWQHTTNSQNKIIAELTGVCVNVAANQGDHAMNYSKYNGNWHVVSDDNILQAIGNNFAQMSNHLYDQLVGQLNGVGFADIQFLQARPSILFYEIIDTGVMVADKERVGKGKAHAAAGAAGGAEDDPDLARALSISMQDQSRETGEKQDRQRQTMIEDLVRQTNRIEDLQALPLFASKQVIEEFAVSLLLDEANLIQGTDFLTEAGKVLLGRWLEAALI